MVLSETPFELPHGQTASYRGFSMRQIQTAVLALFRLLGASSCTNAVETRLSQLAALQLKHNIIRVNRYSDFAF